MIMILMILTGILEILFQATLIIERYKNRFMGPELIWPNITRSVIVAPGEILALIRIRHIVNRNMVIVQTKMY